jgi:MFS family permease
LTVAWTFGNFGDSALYLTLAIWVKDLTGSDAKTGLVFLFLGLPAFLAPLAGHLADRLPRRRLVVVANLVAAAGVMTLSLVDRPGDLWIIYAVTFGYGLLTYVTSSCASGLIRDLLPDEHLAGANGLLQTIDQGLRLLSPLAGAGLFAAFGGTAIAVLTASMLVIAALIVRTVRMQESGPTPVDERGSFWTEFTAGMRHIRRTPRLFGLTALLAVAVGITGFANSTIFAAIDEGLDRSSEFFGVLASVQGAGAVVGGLTSAWVIRRLGERVALTTSLVVLGLALASAAIAQVAVVAAGFFVAGVAIPWTFVTYATIRQRLTPPALQGRVSAAANLALNGPQTFGTAGGAALIAIVDYRLLLAAMAAVIGACAVAALAAGTAPEEPAEQVAKAAA